MGSNEIKAIIDKYKLILKDGKLGTYAKVNKTEFMKEVPPHKAEIIAYFESQEKARQDKIDREQDIFNAIPGVKEIAEARTQRANWTYEFNRMMEIGSSKMPAVKAPSAQELSDLENMYPNAVFALEAQYRANNTENDRLNSIWSATYQAILDGQDISTVKADHDARMSKYTNSVMFN